MTASLDVERQVDRTAPATGVMLVVDELVKQYPKRPTNAVDGISFAVGHGEIFGLLGPNGAGKTTTIGAMTTRVVPTSGRILVAGIDVARDPVAAKRRFGVVSQRNNLDRSLTARQNLVFHAAYFGFSKRRREQAADALLEEFGLADRANDRTDDFSGGMAQRLMIARALMHDPELLFLDEPATGLDPQSRLFVHERIAALHARGVTILITTHDMHEAEKLCERIAIMDHGGIIAIDRTEELRKLVPAGNALELDVVFPRGPAEGPLVGSDQKRAPGSARGPLPSGAEAPEGALDGLLEALGRLPGVEGVERVAPPERSFGPPPGVPPQAMAFMSLGPPAGIPTGPPRVRVYGESGTELVPVALRTAAELGAVVTNLRLLRPSLEDVFIHLTGRALR
jgi:ABC-2 type transport system ATP-binding protein